MTFEDRLEAAFERYVQGAPRDVDPHLVARAALASGGRGRLERLARVFDTPAMRLAAAVVVLLLSLAAAVIIGSALQREPPLPIVQGRFTFAAPLTADGMREAVVLSDGRVLLVGSRTQPNSGDEIGIAEIFDPETGSVTRLDGAPSPRNWTLSAVVRLLDGRVLVVGGEQFDTQGQRPAPAETVDPATGAVTQVGPMVHQRYGHTATVMNDGRVLVAGGDASIGANPGPNPPAEVFDPTTGSFDTVGPLQHARMYHQGTLLEDGRVLLTGGYGPGDVLPAEVFDPATGTFSVVGELRQGRVHHSSTLLADGRVLLVGGSALDDRGIISDDAAASAELFDPATGRFAEAGGLTTERSQHEAVLLKDGRVLIAGGYNRNGSPSSTELFDPGTSQFVRGADALDRFGQATGALLPDGRVYILGEGGPPELFDPSTTSRVEPTPAPRADLAGALTAIDGPAMERFGHTATLLADGRVLVTGGTLDDRTVFDTAELYDPATGRWSATGSLNEARARHVATLLDDGRVLIAGGRKFEPPEQGGEFLATDSAEVYDPATGVFVPVGPMTAARGGGSLGGGVIIRLAAVPLADGRVLIGAGDTEPPSFDLFDPRSNTFSGVRSGCAGRPVLLSDGRVLLGCNGGSLFDPREGSVVAGDAEALAQFGTTLADGRVLFGDGIGLPLILDPDEPMDGLPWMDVEMLLRERLGGDLNIQASTALPDGRMLVFARGFDEDHQRTRGFAAVFDPRLATFTEVASPASRYAPTATLLHDGRVLFVGRPDRSPDRTDPDPPAAELLDLGLSR
jgi:hypothetical protein